MKEVKLVIPEIPHGHGLSFKKGVVDGLLDTKQHENSCHATHAASYLRGYEVGGQLKDEVAKHVKP